MMHSVAVGWKFFLRVGWVHRADALPPPPPPCPIPLPLRRRIGWHRQCFSYRSGLCYLSPELTLAVLPLCHASSGAETASSATRQAKRRLAGEDSEETVEEGEEGGEEHFPSPPQRGGRKDGERERMRGRANGRAGELRVGIRREEISSVEPGVETPGGGQNVVAGLGRSRSVAAMKQHVERKGTQR
eukprot:1427490-Rhodomonas_salina.2